MVRLSNRPPSLPARRLEPGVDGSFAADAGRRAVACQKERVVGKSEDVLFNRVEKRLGVAVGEIGPADAPGEDHVADENDGSVFGR